MDTVREAETSETNLYLIEVTTVLHCAALINASGGESSSDLCTENSQASHCSHRIE